MKKVKITVRKEGDKWYGIPDNGDDKIYLHTMTYKGTPLRSKADAIATLQYIYSGGGWQGKKIKNGVVIDVD